jgi:excisionase family DNA binding protein
MREQTVDFSQSAEPNAAATTALLRPEQAAQTLGISRHIISGWINHGDLPVVRTGRRRLIAPADLAAVHTRLHLNGIVPAWQQERLRCGQRLRALREARGLSQLDLAAVSGLTHEAISRLETSYNAPYADTVRTLARALEVAPAQFVGTEPLGLSEWSVREAAQHLGVPVMRTRDWVRAGVLPGRKVSGQWRVPAVAVRELGRSGRLRGQSLRLDPRYRG